MLLTFVPHRAFSQVVNFVTSPPGRDPNADAFNSAARSCCSNCILAWLRLERFTPPVVFETSDQKPPIRVELPAGAPGWAFIVSVSPQIAASPMVAATPGKL